MVIFSVTALPSIPVELWVWAGVTLLMTAAIGFTAGVVYGRSSIKRTCQRARKQLSTLFELVVQTIESAQEACVVLEKFPNMRLTSDQTDQLQGKQNRLLETVRRIVTGQQSAEPSPDDPVSRAANPVDFEVGWVVTPEDRVTGLPDRTAFDANLASILESGNLSGVESGLLLIKVDKFSQLSTRLGAEGAKTLLRKLTRVVLRAARDDDVICHYKDQTFGVFMPAVDLETGRQLAESIRNTVRNYHFQLDSTSPEVLVTASFGYTSCLPGDGPDLVLNRAGNAISKSERRGRNQLHVDDGNKLAHCLVR